MNQPNEATSHPEPDTQSSGPGLCIIGAIGTAILGLMSAPICWILRDGLLGAYPSHGLGAVSHFFWSLLWGVWPVSTLVLLLIGCRSRKVRCICLGLLSVCILIFMMPLVYAKAYIDYMDTPFQRNASITLWQQGIGRIYHWPADTDFREDDKIWQDWEIAHNSTHCWRNRRGALNARLPSANFTTPPSAGMKHR
ncbi:MAG: hypothetical protein J6J97_09200 [Akkermansia sp.]|nr:hypothetical protein [Akkermansia sp.]